MNPSTPGTGSVWRSTAWPTIGGGTLHAGDGRPRIRDHPGQADGRGGRPGPRPSRRRTRGVAIMSISTDSGSPALDRPDDVRRARDVLDRVAYNSGQIFDRIASRQTGELSLEPPTGPACSRSHPRRRPAQATLIRLFLVGVPVPLEDFRRAVAADGPGENGPGSAWSSSRGTPSAGSSSLKPIEGVPPGHDAPARRRPAAITSWGSRARRVALPSTDRAAPARWTLDLGTGSGYLALQAAAHSRHVLATDLNPAPSPWPGSMRCSTGSTTSGARRGASSSPRATSGST